MTCGVYKITNTVTGGFYIGQSPNIERRWLFHQTCWQRKTKSYIYNCKLLFESMENVDLALVKFEVLEECPISDLRFRENDYIRRLSPTLNRVGCVSVDSRETLKDLAAKPKKPGLNNLLPEYILSKGLTRHEFAKITKISINTVLFLCSDRECFPDKKVVCKIGKVFPDVRIEDLVDYIHEPKIV